MLPVRLCIYSVIVDDIYMVSLITFVNKVDIQDGVASVRSYTALKRIEGFFLDIEILVVKKNFTEGFINKPGTIHSALITLIVDRHWIFPKIPEYSRTF
jgi:hypothetical protein